MKANRTQLHYWRGRIDALSAIIADIKITPDSPEEFFNFYVWLNNTKIAAEWELKKYTELCKREAHEQYIKTKGEKIHG